MATRLAAGGAGVPPVPRPRLAALASHIGTEAAGCQPCAPRLAPATASDHATAASGSEEQPPLSIFLLLGQSNMAGRGLLPPGSATLAPPDDVLCFSYDDDTWAPAAQPMHFDPPIVASLTGSASGDPLETIESGGAKGAGLGWSFARRLLDAGYVDGQVGLVPCAFGGSPLSRWEKKGAEHPDEVLEGADGQAARAPRDIYPGKSREIPPNPQAGQPPEAPGDLYERAFRRAKLALEAHPNAVLRGFLW